MERPRRIDRALRLLLIRSLPDALVAAGPEDADPDLGARPDPRRNTVPSGDATKNPSASTWWPSIEGAAASSAPTLAGQKPAAPGIAKATTATTVLRGVPGRAQAPRSGRSRYLLGRIEAAVACV
jgi:hypothetical protein